MTKEEIDNIWLHTKGKAEGISEAGGNADFPVLFANAILEYKMAGKLKDLLKKYEKKDLQAAYEHGVVDGRQIQMQTSVDRAVNAIDHQRRYRSQ